MDYVSLCFLVDLVLGCLSHFFVLGALPALPPLDGFIMSLLLQVKEARIAVDRRSHDGNEGALSLLLVNTLEILPQLELLHLRLHVVEGLPQRVILEVLRVSLHRGKRIEEVHLGVSRRSRLSEEVRRLSRIESNRGGELLVLHHFSASLSQVGRVLAFGVLLVGLVVQRQQIVVLDILDLLRNDVVKMLLPLLFSAL